MYIVIDGIDGSGKTSLINEMNSRLRTQGFTPVVLAEPSHGEYGREVRSLIQSGGLRNIEKERELFTLDRKDHIEKVINPLLNLIKTHSNFVILQDRGYTSYPACQAEDETEVDDLLNEHRSFTPEPDLIFILDLPVETAVKRIEDRNKEAIDLEKPAILEKAKSVYKSMPARIGNHVQIIDAEQSVNTTANQILEIILKDRR